MRLLLSLPLRLSVRLLATLPSLSTRIRLARDAFGPPHRAKGGSRIASLTLGAVTNAVLVLVVATSAFFSKSLHLYAHSIIDS